MEEALEAIIDEDELLAQVFGEPEPASAAVPAAEPEPAAPAAEAAAPAAAAIVAPAAGEAEPSLDDQAASPELRRGAYGVFRLTPRAPTVQDQFGGFQAECPFHKKNRTSGCRKYVPIGGPSQKHWQDALRLLCTWCLRYNQIDRQRSHITDLPLLEDCPDATVLRAMTVREGPARPVYHDDDLDRMGVGRPPIDRPWIWVPNRANPCSGRLRLAPKVVDLPPLGGTGLAAASSSSG